MEGTAGPVGLANGPVSISGNSGVYTYTYAGGGIVTYTYTPNNPSNFQVFWSWVKRNSPMVTPGAAPGTQGVLPAGGAPAFP